VINSLMTESEFLTRWEHPVTLNRLNAAAYSDDPGTSDLDDEQPAHSVAGLTLGDVRLARRLVR
jgi:hypothetical protein